MDFLIFKLINGLAEEFLTLDWLAIFFAKYLPYILLLVFLYIFLKKRDKILLLGLISALISRFVFTELIRFFYSRPRPFQVFEANQLIEHSPGDSFPSGHMAFFFALSAGVYAYNKKAGLWFFSASLLIGLARIFSGLHWPSDILGGFAIAIFSFWLVRKLLNRKKIIEVRPQ